MKRAVLFVALLVAGVSSAAAQTTLQVPYTYFTLPNGLNVILHEDHSVPLVTVNVWYHVGSANERPGRTGFAHLFEHLMFMGSGHVKPGEFDAWLEASGRQQQRLDDQRSHELLDQRAVERARSGALPRIGPHGLPARLDDAANGRRAARRRQERAPPELREPAVRRGGAAARRNALSEGASLPLAGHRLHGRPDRRQLRRHRRVLQAVLRALERQPGRRRRHRPGDSAAAGREVVQRCEGGPAPRTDDHPRRGADRASSARRSPIACSCRGSPSPG